MARSYQKNQAIKMHNEYMQKFKVRSRLGLEVFMMTYGIKPNEIKIKVGGRF